MDKLKVVAWMLLAVVVAGVHLGPVGAQLSPTFYSSSCPNVDVIVRSTIITAMNQSQIVGPSVLRVFAHDCFVGGCDASIMLVDSPGQPQTELDASDNLSLQPLAFSTINQAKQAVEAQCPGVVSCADIISLASRDVTNLMGGPAWPVVLGRRDGLNSTATSVVGHLPGSNMNVTALMTIFQGLGLSTQDLVVLSGTHTVGFAHCDEFANRLYNFNNISGAVDPSLAPLYASTLTGVCPNGNFSSSAVQALDPQTAAQFDNLYYQDLLQGKGLLFSDQVLFVDNRTSSLVTSYGNNQTLFFNDFVTSMIAFSQIGVLTGTQGEIRTNCSVINSNATAQVPPTPTIPSPLSPPPVIAPSPPTPATIIPPPPPVVIVPSPPPPVVFPSPPPPVISLSPPPAPVIVPSPPPVVLPPPSPPPPQIATVPPPPGGRR